MIREKEEELRCNIFFSDEWEIVNILTHTRKKKKNKQNKQKLLLDILYDIFVVVVVGDIDI